jgi:hypothetical protein
MISRESWGKVEESINFLDDSRLMIRNGPGLCALTMKKHAGSHTMMLVHRMLASGFRGAEGRGAEGADLMDSREADKECCLERGAVRGKSGTEILSAAPLKDCLLFDPRTDACISLPLHTASNPVAFCTKLSCLPSFPQIPIPCQLKSRRGTPSFLGPSMTPMPNYYYTPSGEL